MSPHRPALLLAAALVCVGLSASPVLASTGPAGDPSATGSGALGEHCVAVPPIYVGSALVYPGGRYCVLLP